MECWESDREMILLNFTPLLLSPISTLAFFDLSLPLLLLLSRKILEFLALLKLLLLLLFISRVWFRDFVDGIHIDSQWNKIMIIEKFLVDFITDKFYLVPDLLDFSVFKNYIKIISTISTIVYIINVWMLNKLCEKNIQIRCRIVTRFNNVMKQLIKYNIDHIFSQF